MPIPTQNRTVLKSYFETNNVPSEQDYADLIDAAMIQADDGLYKFAGDPLIIDAAANGSSRRPVLRLTSDYNQNPQPDWLIELDPNGGNGSPGLNFADQNQTSSLFLSSDADKRVGIGTTQPGARLHVHNDSSVAWQFLELQNNVSLELGHSGPGGVGSVKLNGGGASDFLFLRASGEAARMDYSNGQYLLNGDPSVTGGHAGVLQIADGNGDARVRIHSDGNSFLANGNLGLGNDNPQARLHVTGGAIMPQTGNNDQSGIMFPRDAFGGSGDAAWIRYYSRGGESTTFEIGTANDGDDNLALVSPGGVGINHNAPSAALDILSSNPNAIALRSNQWSPAEKFRINAEGTGAGRRVSMRMESQGFSSIEVHSTGRVFVKDPERTDGNGLRVGALWGDYGIFAEAGPVAIGGATGVSMQNGQVHVLPDGKMGIGTGTPTAKLHIANDSPAAYLYNDVANHVSLELGQDAPGALGSIKLHSYEPGHYNFIRPSNGNFHLDSSRGFYYLNWDPSVHGGVPGNLIIGGRSGNNVVMLSTEGNSFLNGGNLGIGTPSPDAKLEVVSPGDHAFSLRRETWAGDARWRINTEGGPGSEFLAISWKNINDRRLVLTAGGNVGIGTYTPGAKLHIANDGPVDWRYGGLVNSVSLELGKNGGGGSIGSIKLNSTDQDHFSFIRPSNGNLHIDSTRGAYFLNWDTSCNGGNHAQVFIGDNQGAEKIAFRTSGNSHFSGGNLGIGTSAPSAKLQVVGGAIMPQPGNSDQSGIMFPRDPFGGGGDAAWMRYYSRGGETTTLELGTTNDWDDNIALMSTGGVGINTNQPAAALEINSPNASALALRNNAWTAGKKLRIDTNPGGTASIRWEGHNYPLVHFWDSGRTFFKDQERQDGNGLRVGSAWGKYGIYAEAGPVVVGGAEGVKLQNELLTITTDGKMAVGQGRVPGTGKLLVDGRVDIQQGAVPLFGGIHPPATDDRAQLVLQSRYSDLVIASSEINHNHGSTLSFATSNPANPAEYRKFVFNQGNWGDRKHFMEIGYVDQAKSNPHEVVWASNLMTLNGQENKVGIANRNPEAALDVTGEIKTSTPYLRTTAETFTVGGSLTTWYPIVFQDKGWGQGILELEIFRENTHVDASWYGTIMARIRNHNSNWGHGSAFWELDVVQDGRFIAGVGHVHRAPKVIVWLRGATTYRWRSNQKVVLVDYTAVDTKITFAAGGGPDEESVTSITSLSPEFDKAAFYVESVNRGNSFQRGMVMMWSGTAAPNGWAICDGSNGTPDLRGRFVLGAGHGSGLTNRLSGQVGGAESVALSVAQLPAHSHPVNDPGHFHTWTASRQMAGVDDHNNGSEFSRGDNAGSDPVIKNTDSKATGISIGNTGSNAAHENMPPFFVLAYIMKL